MQTAVMDMAQQVASWATAIGALIAAVSGACRAAQRVCYVVRKPLCVALLPQGSCYFRLMTEITDVVMVRIVTAAPTRPPTMRPTCRRVSGAPSSLTEIAGNSQ